MKIKNDFVTNSSSVAYISSIPIDFSPKVSLVIEKYRYHDEDGEEWEEDKICSEFMDAIDILKAGGNIYNGYDEGCDTAIFNTVLDICNDVGFILTSVDIGPDSGPIIQSIKEEDMNKWFMNNQLQKMKLEVDDEQN